MPIVINGTGTITGLSVGGLPDGTIDRDTLETKAKGSILQVLSMSSTTEYQYSSTTYADTDITLNITPSSTSHKILAIASLYTRCYATDYVSLGIKLLRDSTTVFENSLFMQNSVNAAVNTFHNTPLTVLDAPSTTSQITYKIQGAETSTGSGTHLAGIGLSNKPSHLTLLEVAL